MNPRQEAKFKDEPSFVLPLVTPHPDMPELFPWEHKKIHFPKKVYFYFPLSTTIFFFHLFRVLSGGGQLTNIINYLQCTNGLVSVTS